MLNMEVLLSFYKKIFFDIKFNRSGNLEIILKKICLQMAERRITPKRVIQYEKQQAITTKKVEALKKKTLKP